MTDNNNNNNNNNFLSLYLQYTARTECPIVFHRWTGLSILAAWLARDIHFKFGHFNLYPNLYCLFIAAPGTRKTTAINIGKKLLAKTGYKAFSAQKTRQEKYLEDLSESLQDKESELLELNIFGSLKPTAPTESYIAADEFGNFIGAGNLDFMSILGELWDYDGMYKYKLKNSKDIYIWQPTINILGGITATEFNRVFPPEALGQGFFSRLLIIHDEPTGIKHTIPPEPDEQIEKQLLELFIQIKEKMKGEISISKDAYTLLDKIYKSWKNIPDARFEHYATRRLTHLIKLCLVVAASDMNTKILKSHIIYANTILTAAEHLMPKALGEFGKGRHSEVSHKVLQLLNNTDKPLSFKDLWQNIHADLDRRDQLVEILQNLAMADKIQTVEGDIGGYLPIKKVMEETCSEALDWNLLSSNELKLLTMVK